MIASNTQPGRFHHVGRRVSAALTGVLCAVMLLWCAGCDERGGGPGGTGPAATSQVVDLAGAPRDPLHDGDAKVTVLLFVSTQCPISNSYAPELGRLHDRFGPRGVAFWLVYADPTETVDAMRQHHKAYSYPFAALQDPGHELVKLAHATVTPEAAVFVRSATNGVSKDASKDVTTGTPIAATKHAAAKLVYHGRIDDWYVDFGLSRAAPTQHDLADALEAALSGKPVIPAVTKAVGCYIPPVK